MQNQGPAIAVLKQTTFNVVCGALYAGELEKHAEHTIRQMVLGQFGQSLLNQARNIKNGICHGDMGRF